MDGAGAVRGAVAPAPSLGMIFEKRKTAGKRKPAVVLFGRKDQITQEKPG